MAHYRPDQGEIEDEGGTPCACGKRCAEGDYQGNAKCGPRAFCGTDQDFVGRAIVTLPQAYVHLRLMLPRSDQAGERVKTSRGTPVPLAADVEAFMREIVHVACSWEEQVRGVARLSDYGAGHRRDGVALAQACRTLFAHLGTLLSLEPEAKVRFASRARLAELEVADPDMVPHFDTAGDAWVMTGMDGAAAGLEFLALAGRARGMQGLTRQRRRITEVPCDGCDLPTLVQYESVTGGWEPAAKCTNCPVVYAGQNFGHLMGRVYEAQVAAIDAERRRRAAA